MRAEIRLDRVPYLTILSNVFLGFALGRIVMTPAEELIESVPIKVLLIVGTCLLFNYLLCVRKATKGITCCASGKIRPFLKELFICAAVNAFILFLSLGLFFFKSTIF